MTILMNREGKLTAYLYNNMIISATLNKVIGIVLGRCVFGRTGAVKGKLINRIFYSLSGEIISWEHELPRVSAEKFYVAEHQQEGWAILADIKDHYCPWIHPSQQWSSISVDDLLRQTQTVTLIRRKNREIVL